MVQPILHNDDSENVALGMWAAGGAFLMFTIMNVFAKYLSSGHSVIEIAFYRNLVACVPFLLAAFMFGRREILVIQSKPRIVAVRAILGTVTLITTFAAYSLMPMAETTVLMFTASLFIPVLGVVFLKERVGPYRWSAVLAGFVGVAIMVNPTGETNTLGVTIALCAALLQAFMSILLRHLGGHELPQTITFYFFVIGTFLTGLALPFVATGPTLAEIPLFFGVGLSGAAAQWLYSIALKHTPAAVVAVLNYSSIVWAMLFGWLIWNDWPLPVVLAGAGVVIASNMLIAWRESRLRRSLRAKIPQIP
jgi:drug/metabolite transporter (DMT)-like permease